jgi:hypothetical protein
MKTPNSVSDVPRVPSLFQIAAFFEDFFPNGRIKRYAPSVRQLPFADLMVNPKKLMKVLNSGTASVQAAPNVEKTRPQAKRGARTGSAKKPANQSTGKDEDFPPNMQRLVEFALKSPVASSVKLAGDFTEWEKCPVDLEHSGEGFWSAVVPLAPGVYTYRFIVDGQWCDDPRCHMSAPNGFGAQNSVIQVV